jgi:predicted GTPase
MVNSNQELSVGTIGSTTRRMEGVRTQLGAKTITLVDSPGIGEAFTDEDYHYGVVDWYSKNHSSVTAILLVIQADAKAHADDKRLVDGIRFISAKPLLIALNHADKIKPIRESLYSDDWESEQRRSSAKANNLREKISEIHNQFSSEANLQVIPVASEPGAYFNRSRLIKTIQSVL